MNLDLLNSAAETPALSYVLWVVAAASLAGTIFVMVRNGANWPWALMLWVLTCGAGSSAYALALDASAQVRNSSFQAELQKSYGLRTTATLDEVEEAAGGSGSILLRGGNDMYWVDAFEARPHLDGSTLIFIRALDGKVVEPIAR